MKTLSIIALAISAQILTPNLLAQGTTQASESKKKQPKPPGEFFKKWDKDSNGRISKYEFLALPRSKKLPEKLQNEVFLRMDKNKDGELDRNEIRQMHRADAHQRAKNFRKLDTDKSGGLNFAEMSADKFFSKLTVERRKEIFQRMDTDGNGEINALDRANKKKCKD